MTARKTVQILKADRQTQTQRHLSESVRFMYMVLRLSLSFFLSCLSLSVCLSVSVSVCQRESVDSYFVEGTGVSGNLMWYSIAGSVRIMRIIYHVILYSWKSESQCESCNTLLLRVRESVKIMWWVSHDSQWLSRSYSLAESVRISESYHVILCRWKRKNQWELSCDPLLLKA